MSSPPLAALERRRFEFGAAAAQAKLALLGRLARTRLGSARAVMRLHEALCFIRAYPDSAAVLAQVQAMLAAFDTGIGTGSSLMGWVIHVYGFRVGFACAAIVAGIALPYFLVAEKKLGFE